MAQTLLSQHAVHAIAVGVPVVMLTVGLTWDAARTRRRAVDIADRPSLLTRGWAPGLAAAASAAAAAVHLVVLPEHAAESAVYGAFFAGAATAQLGAAWLLWFRGSRLVYAITAAANAGIIALWLFTRLVAVPIGPGAGSTEGFGALDVAASTLEMVVVVGCVACLQRRTATRRHSPDTRPAPQLVDVR